MAATLQAIQDAGVTDPELLAGVLSDADLLALMDEADRAPEPGTAALGLGPDGQTIRDPRAVIFRGDEEAPAPIMALALKSAGYVLVYDRTTAERSVVSRNNLPQVLRKRNEQGQRVFTTRKPDFAPKRGTVKCQLHPDERTAEMDEMGLPTCSKANLTSQYQQRLHMQHRHKSAYEALEEQRKLEREQEERESRLAIARIAGGAPRTSAPKPAAQTAEPEEGHAESPAKRERTPAQIAHSERLAQQARERAAARKQEAS